MDTTDITNRIQDEQEAEELAEQIRATEEDHDLDSASFERRRKQEEAARTQIIKEMYARLYEFGLSTEKVRSKLDKLSMFFGNIGGVSNMSNEEIGIVCQMLNYMKISGYKFNF